MLYAVKMQGRKKSRVVVECWFRSVVSHLDIFAEIKVIVLEEWDDFGFWLLDCTSDKWLADGWFFHFFGGFLDPVCFQSSNHAHDCASTPGKAIIAHTQTS